VPDTYPGNYVTLKYSPETIELVSDNEVLARHERRFGKEELAYDPTHFLKTFSRKPGALPHSRVSYIPGTHNEMYANGPYFN